MKHLRDIGHVSVTPKFFTIPQNGRRFEWRSDIQPLLNFISSLKIYAEANGFPAPTREAVEDELCRQMPDRECVGESGGVAALAGTAVASKGCCGGKR